MGSCTSQLPPTASNTQKPDSTSFRDQYKIKERLGQGSFATVHKCTRKSDQSTFAVKKIKKSHLNNVELSNIKEEINILETLDHPNIIELIDVVEEKNSIWIVLELCKRKDLCENLIDICDVNGRMSEARCARIIFQTANALHCMHEQGITHRDLKPENILFSQDGVIKVSDFGLAQSKTTMDSCCGTPYYVAPEVLLQGPYSSACDFWSLGVILYNLLVGEQPFVGRGLQQIYENICKVNYNFRQKDWKKVSTEAKHLVTKLLEKDVDRRYGWEDICRHPWIRFHLKDFLEKEDSEKEEMDSDSDKEELDSDSEKDGKDDSEDEIDD